jgi:hypothetical protein
MLCSSTLKGKIVGTYQTAWHHISEGCGLNNEVLWVSKQTGAGHTVCNCIFLYWFANLSSKIKDRSYPMVKYHTMIMWVNGGIAPHIVNCGPRWWSGSWPGHLTSPQGRKSPQYGREAGMGLSTVEKSEPCSCQESNPCFPYCPTHSLILNYCMWMLTKTSTVYSQDAISSNSFHTFCCWNCGRTEHCMM